MREVRFNDSKAMYHRGAVRLALGEGQSSAVARTTGMRDRHAEPLPQRTELDFKRDVDAVASLIVARERERPSSDSKDEKQPLHTDIVRSAFATGCWLSDGHCYIAHVQALQRLFQAWEISVGGKLQSPTLLRACDTS